LGVLGAHEEETVGSPLLRNEPLEKFVGHGPKQAKEINEVALARAVGADEDIQVPEGKVLQLPDGLESSQRDLVNWPAHRPESRSLPGALFSMR
jgi:hypothetical protein